MLALLGPMVVRSETSQGISAFEMVGYGYAALLFSLALLIVCAAIYLIRSS